MSTGFYMVEHGEIVELDFIHSLGVESVEDHTYTSIEPHVETIGHWFEASINGTVFEFRVNHKASEKQSIDAMVEAYRQVVKRENA